MTIEVDKVILEKEIQRVFKNLPNICCDTASYLYIVNTLVAAYEEDFKCEFNTDY